MTNHLFRRWSTPLLLTCALLWLCSGIATAAVRTVTNTNDSGPGSLRQTIASAALGDTVEFAVNGTITLTSGALLINKDLSINGPGAANLAISGNNAGRVITIVTNGGTVNLSGLTITQGTALVGGGISNSGTTVTLDDCVITGNHAEQMGAGIFSSRYIAPSGDVFSNLTLNRCIVSDNHATTTNGSFGGGGIRAENGTLTINDSSITGNSAFSGGGIYCIGAAVSINHCSISNNRTLPAPVSAPVGAGGGIYAGRLGTVGINNSNLDSNVANVFGGAIYNVATLTIINSTLSRNSARIGGAISNQSDYRSGILTLVNSTVTGSNSGGAAIYNAFHSTIRNSTIVGNAAGGIHWSYTGSLTIYSTIVAGNTLGNVTTDDSRLIPTIQYSMIGGDPKLGPLQNNGGPTLTFVPLPGSPVIDAGSCGTGATALETDQRGYRRRADFLEISNAHDACDIGATELGILFIHGRISTSSGVALPGVKVTIDGTSLSAITNNAGYYSLGNVPPGTHTVTPSLAGHYFSPAQRTVTVADSNIINQNFVGRRSHSVYGRISNSSGQPLENVRVTRSGGAPAGPDTSVLTNNAGYFTFRDVPDGTYTITPMYSGYFFTPASRTVTVAQADVGAQNFIGATGFNVYGRIYTSNGSGLAGVEVTLSDGRSTPVFTNSAGYYTFRNVAPGTYTITPGSSTHTFTPLSREVTVTQSDVGTQNFLAQ